MVHLHIERPFHIPNIDGLKALFWNLFLRNFALSIIGIYVPLYIIFLLQEKLKLTTEHAILGLIIYYLISRCVIVIFVFFANWLISHFGIRWSIFWSNVCLVIYLCLLILAKHKIDYLFLAAIILGLLIPFYWVCYHFLFACDGHRKKMGREVGTGAILGRVSKALGPVIGGFLIVKFSFETLFIVSIILVILSSFPPFFMSHHHDHEQVSINDLLAVLFNRNSVKTHLAFWGAGWRDIANDGFWPVFAFLIVGGYEALGVLVSGTTILALVVYLLVGQVFDRKDKRLVLRAGIITNVLLWLGRSFVKTPLTLWLVDSFFRIFHPLLWVSFDALVYIRARENKPFLFLLYREIILNLGVAVMLVILFFCFIFNVGWQGLFVITIIGVMLNNFIIDKYKKI